MSAPILIDAPTLADHVPNLPRPLSRRYCPLRPIELDVLRLYADGYDNEGAARILDKPLETIRSARKRMLVKTATVNRAQIVAVALRNGWIK
jgi:DNA-binding CsgD family transcriptional regulator